MLPRPSRFWKPGRSTGNLEGLAKTKTTMNRAEPLEYGNVYHLYNRGIDGCDLFREPANYEYFFNLYIKHIEPIADTYAWVLMKNHFHFLIRIKDRPPDLPGFGNQEGLCSPKGLEASSDLPGFKNLEGLAKSPHQYFSNLFNAYTKAVNKKYDRTGSLFEKNFHRKRITTQDYLRQVLLYIHNNPVHHGFCSHPSEYPWSSYLSCILVQPAHPCRDTVIGWFDDIGNFKYCHDKKVETDRIEKWLAI
ncbi:MAG TPA: hypothetical protein PKG48_05265 [Bacteroidales bacterium]|nr:hypothetical protein [Bacteroidales bacterium]